MDDVVNSMDKVNRQFLVFWGKIAGNPCKHWCFGAIKIFVKFCN